MGKKEKQVVKESSKNLAILKKIAKLQAKLK